MILSHVYTAIDSCMKQLSHLLLLLLFPALIGSVEAARPVATLPFEMSGSYAVVKMSINGSEPLSFIFDTGVRNTIITHIDDNTNVSLNPGREVPVVGLGSGLDVKGLLSDGNDLKLGKLSMNNRMVMVLEEDVLHLSELNGRKINGLIGVDVLREYVVEVNYTRRKLIFYDTASFQPPENFATRDLIIENNKLYLPMTLFDSSMKLRTIKMFIDTGALLNAWFLTVNNNADESKGPKVYARIGSGFGGDVNGYLTRIPRICLEEYCFENPIVAFPDSAVVAEVIKRSDRDGTIGSELLSRFNLLFDLQRKKLHFKANSFFNAPFVYNIAGMELMQAQALFPGYEVSAVWKDSPADKAGIRVGDQLIGINTLSVFSFSLTEVRALLQKPSRLPMTVMYLRNGQQMQAELNMRNRLPVEPEVRNNRITAEPKVRNRITSEPKRVYKP